MLHVIDELIFRFDHLPALGQAGTAVDGNPHLHERRALCQLVEWRQARTVFEIGTFNGSTAAVLAGLPGVETVWTLDLAPDQSPSLAINPDDARYLHAGVGELPANVTRLYGDSARFDFGPYYGRCDLVFVMGAHSLAYIRNDLRQAFQLAGALGLVVWHAGTPAPVKTIGREYDVYSITERMGLVLQLGQTLADKETV